MYYKFYDAEDKETMYIKTPIGSDKDVKLTLSKTIIRKDGNLEYIGNLNEIY